MENEILAVILWLASIPIVLFGVYALVFLVYMRNSVRIVRDDKLGSLFQWAWPILAGWAVGAAWTILALYNAGSAVVRMIGS